MTIAAWGWFPDGCWAVDSTRCGPIEGDTIPLTVHVTDHWEPDVPCGAVIVEWDLECEYGPLDAGVYELVVTEVYDPLREPLPDTFADSVEVRSATAVGPEPLGERVSWGMLRGTFR